jgi:hypothetical protein
MILIYFFANPFGYTVRAAGPTPNTLPNQIYLPLAEAITTYSISGHIEDSLGFPLEGITISLSNGQTTLSDSQGNYVFIGLPAGVYTYSASGGSNSFSPAHRTASLPPGLTGKNFTSLATNPVALNMQPYYHSQRYETNLDNACGPAALLTNLDYFGIQAGGLDQVIQVTSLSPASGGFDPTCSLNPVCLSAGVMNSVAHNTYGLTTNAHENWTFNLLYSSLGRGQPVIALVTLGLVPDGSGHFVTVYGADPVNRVVYYHDPYYGPSRSAPWTRFYNSWVGPVDQNDPLQPAGHSAWGMSLSK